MKERLLRWGVLAVAGVLLIGNLVQCAQRAQISAEAEALSGQVAQLEDDETYVLEREVLFLQSLYQLYGEEMNSEQPEEVRRAQVYGAFQIGTLYDTRAVYRQLSAYQEADLSILERLYELDRQTLEALRSAPVVQLEAAAPYYQELSGLLYNDSPAADNSW